VDTAVATCGTAFGAEHIKVARRLLSDDGTGGEVVFTFDGDAAGQKAALKAFDEDQRFTAQTFVAVEPSGADPCELRQRKGDEAVHALIRSRRPLFEFAIRSTLAKFDLSTVEGRVNGLRASAPVVAEIRDASTRTGYSQELAGWLGLADPNEVLRAVKAAERRSHNQPGTRGQHNGQVRSGVGTQQESGQQGQGHTEQSVRAQPTLVRPDPRDPHGRMEREALEVVLQHPGILTAGNWQHFAATEFVIPAYEALQRGIGRAGEAQVASSQWLEAVRANVPPELESLVAELALSPLPATGEDTLSRYCRDILNRLFELQITRLKQERLGALQRMDPAVDPAGYQLLQRELMELETARRQLRGDQ
jgi:DNA primase